MYAIFVASGLNDCEIARLTAIPSNDDQGVADYATVGGRVRRRNARHVARPSAHFVEELDRGLTRICLGIYLGDGMSFTLRTRRVPVEDDTP